MRVSDEMDSYIKECQMLMGNSTRKLWLISYLISRSLLWFRQPSSPAWMPVWGHQIFPFYVAPTGTALAQWLRRCATNLKVACSIPAVCHRNFSLT